MVIGLYRLSFEKLLECRAVRLHIGPVECEGVNGLRLERNTHATCPSFQDWVDLFGGRNHAGYPAIYHDQLIRG